MPLYIRSWIAVKPQNAVERELKFIPAAFIVFFLLSTLRGYVQPQWVIVAVFGLVYTLFTYAWRHPRTRRYLMRMGWVTLALIALTPVSYTHLSGNFLRRSMICAFALCRLSGAILSFDT